jgi:hypothetical protein
MLLAFAPLLAYEAVQESFPLPVNRTIDDYLDLITAYHRGRYRFSATVALSTEPFVALQALLSGLPEVFDLDEAVGAQLDVDGQWIGRTRKVEYQLPTPWFSFDDPVRGFESGIWYDPDDPADLPDYGLTSLDDDTYRRLLRAKIVANQWDGSIEQATAALQQFFGPTGTLIFIADHQDMTMSIYGAGVVPDLVSLSILDAGYLPFKPAGVAISYGVVSTTTPAPLFGFDIENEYVAGFDTGAWAVTPEYLLSHSIS